MYCEKADLEAGVKTGNLDRWTGGDDTKVTAAINNASAEIDGFLISGGYTVPLSPIPHHIKGHAVSLALYKLAVIRGISDAPADKELIEQKKAAVRFLEGVASGKFRIPTGEGSGESEPTTPAGKVMFKSPSKMNLNGYG